MGFKLSSIQSAVKPEGGNFGPIEPGLYMAHIEEAKKVIAKTGSEGLALVLQVKDLEGNNKGKVWHTVYFTAKNMYAVKCFMCACGIFDAAEEDTELEIEQIAQLVEKRDILVQTKIREAHDGYKARAEVDVFGPMGGFAPLEEVNKWYTIIVEGKEYVDEDVPDMEQWDDSEFLEETPSANTGW